MCLSVLSGLFLFSLYVYRDYVVIKFLMAGGLVEVDGEIRFGCAGNCSDSQEKIEQVYLKSFTKFLYEYSLLMWRYRRFVENMTKDYGKGE